MSSLDGAVTRMVGGPEGVLAGSGSALDCAAAVSGREKMFIYIPNFSQSPYCKRTRKQQTCERWLLHVMFSCFLVDEGSTSRPN